MQIALGQLTDFTIAEYFVVCVTEHTGELRETRRPRRPWKTTAMDDKIIISLVNKYCKK